MENWVFTQKNKEIPSNITEKERLRLYKFHKNKRFFFFFSITFVQKVLSSSQKSVNI